MIPGSANPLLLAAAAPTADGGDRSLRFNSSDSAYLSKNFASAGNRTTWTWAGWVKKGTNNERLGIFGTGTSNINWTNLFFDSSDNTIQFRSEIADVVTCDVKTQPLYRDPSAWYHLVFALDATNSTSVDRVKIYINGVRQALAILTTPGNSSSDYLINTTNASAIGARSRASFENYLNGYLADIHFIDGQALDPSSFGEFDANNVWQPKAYSGSYGTNGFHLPFSDNSTAAALGTDTSGAGNDWTVNNISVTAGSGNDSLVDVPTNGTETDTGVGGEVRGNYCTMNPLKKGSTDIALSNGNLDGTRPSTGTAEVVLGTIGMTTGKWYWEMVWTSGTFAALGIATDAIDLDDNIYGPNGWAYQSNGRKGANSSTSSYGATFAIGDVIAVAFNADNGQLTFYKNNTSQGVAFTVTAGVTYFPSFGIDSMTGWSVNFGQRPFAYTAPSGFKALCTTNLPAPLVAKPNEVMDVKLYTGNGSTQTISGLGFSPDLVWTKRRDGASSHGWFDIVRGATKWLGSNSTNSEQTYSDSLTSFNSDGFSLGADTAWNGINQSSQTYVAWTWDAGSSTVSNTDGSITSQVRANQTAGFSIVSYSSGSAPTVGHGLGVAPSLILAKSRTTSNGWAVYHRSLGKDNVLVLNSTGAVGNVANYWGSSEPSSTVFGTYGSGSSNNNAGNMIAYCFAPVDGYSAFGSYVGNGSSDGPMVYTGFKVRWLLLRKYDSGNNDWYLYDTTRDEYNPASKELLPNTSSAENPFSFGFGDFLSNGFKIRTTEGSINSNGASVLYAAFAESPFQYARAR